MWKSRRTARSARPPTKRCSRRCVRRPAAVLGTRIALGHTSDRVSCYWVLSDGTGNKKLFLTLEAYSLSSPARLTAKRGF